MFRPASSAVSEKTKFAVSNTNLLCVIRLIWMSRRSLGITIAVFGGEIRGSFGGDASSSTKYVELIARDSYVER